MRANRTLRGPTLPVDRGLRSYAVLLRCTNFGGRYAVGFPYGIQNGSEGQNGKFLSFKTQQRYAVFWQPPAPQ